MAVSAPPASPEASTTLISNGHVAGEIESCPIVPPPPQEALITLLNSPLTDIKAALKIYLAYLEALRLYIEDQKKAKTAISGKIKPEHVDLYTEDPFYFMALSKEAEAFKRLFLETSFPADFIDISINTYTKIMESTEGTALSFDDFIPCAIYFLANTSKIKLQKFYKQADEHCKNLSYDDQNKGYAVCCIFWQNIALFNKDSDLSFFFFPEHRIQAFNLALLNIYYLEMQHNSLSKNSFKLAASLTKPSRKAGKLMYVIFKKLSIEEIKDFFNALLKIQPLTDEFLAQMMAYLFDKAYDEINLFSLDTINASLFPTKESFSEESMMITHTLIRFGYLEAARNIIEFVFTYLAPSIAADFLKRINFNDKELIRYFVNLEHHQRKLPPLKFPAKIYHFSDASHKAASLMAKFLNGATHEEMDLLFTNLLTENPLSREFLAQIMACFFEEKLKLFDLHYLINFFFPNDESFSNTIVMLTRCLNGFGYREAINTILEISFARLQSTTAAKFLLAARLDIKTIEVLIARYPSLIDAFGLRGKKTDPARHKALYEFMFKDTPAPISLNDLLKRWIEYFEDKNTHFYKRVLARRIYELLSGESITIETIAELKASQAASFAFALEKATNHNIFHNRFAKLWEATESYVAALPPPVRPNPLISTPPPKTPPPRAGAGGSPPSSLAFRRAWEEPPSSTAESSMDHPFGLPPS